MRSFCSIKLPPNTELITRLGIRLRAPISDVCSSVVQEKGIVTRCEHTVRLGRSEEKVA